MTETAKTKVAILGSGAAGLTAAIYAARARLEPIVIQGHQPGGQLTITTDVENFPGFESGIMGPELMQVMTKQAERFGTKMLFGEVVKVDLESTPKVIHLDDDSRVEADTVIIATGATARLLGLESEAELMGYGVSACATCDGFFFRDKKVAIVGGGDSAMEEATFLAKFASEVVLLHRRDSFRASQIMQERALSNPKISVRWNTEVTKVLGDKDSGVTGLELRDTVTGEASTMETDGFFLAIGHIPNTGFLGDELTKDESGYLITEPGTTLTQVEGVFAAGDVADSRYRQAITAAGSGCKAALDAEQWLAARGLAG